MRWAFWRSRPRPGPSREHALPEDVGLPAGASPAPTLPSDERDEPSQLAPQPGFSGASPDAAQAPARRTPDTAVADPGHLDPQALSEAGAQVVAAVRGVLAGDVAAVERALAPLDDMPALARGASTLAAHALARRLPALSGVSGEVVFDEPAEELLHAYAELLSERAEPVRRRVAPSVREEVSAVAHLAAGAAVEEVDRLAGPVRPEREPASPRLVLPGLPARQQLLVTCVLLAQTCRDGGGDVDALAAELRDLVREVAPG